MNYWLIFLTGLTTGGLACLALQGGLLASAMVEDEDQNKNKTRRIHTIALFLLSKLIAYTILGGLLGLIGKSIGLTPRGSGILDLFIAIFMLGVAAEALDLHPIFRYFLIQPPKFVRDRMKKDTGKGDFAAIFLGAFTVLIPCGVTQAMMAFAVSSGSLFNGAATMFVFILGTIPVFFVLGYLASSLGDRFEKIFRKVIAILLIVLSIYTFSTAAKLLGWTVNQENTAPQATATTAVETKPDDQPSVQKVTVKINDTYGYSPSTINLKRGVPVEVTLQNDGAQGCIRAFVVPSLNKQVLVPTSGSTTLTFTPIRSGKISFTCSMGMYNGEFIVN